MGENVRPNSLVPGPKGVAYPPLSVQQRLYPPDEFNLCLADESALWQWVNYCGGLRALCPGIKYKDPPWVKMPPQGKRYSKISSIALPAVEGTDFVVASRLVPTGYDSCIVSTINLYTGLGFQEGSGDIVWRIKLNLRYAKDYGSITTSIGSLQTPYNINSGQILVNSQNLVQYVVRLGTGALGNLVGGRIVCALFGWDWPR
jgi:hypothetical protein